VCGLERSRARIEDWFTRPKEKRKKKKIRRCYRKDLHHIIIEAFPFP
jgi:hypothetical protein